MYLVAVLIVKGASEGMRKNCIALKFSFTEKETFMCLGPEKKDFS